MNRVQTRAEPDTETHYVSGLAVPWDQRITYGEFEYESFAPDSVALADDAIPLRWQHDRISVPIGVIERAESRPEGLWVECRLFRNDQALAAFEAAEAGLAGGFSVEFVTPDQEGEGWALQGRVEAATLTGLSLVEDPAYPGAVIEAVRSRKPFPARLAALGAWLWLDNESAE